MTGIYNVALSARGISDFDDVVRGLLADVVSSISAARTSEKLSALALLATDAPDDLSITQAFASTPEARSQADWDDPEPFWWPYRWPIEYRIDVSRWLVACREAEERLAAELQEQVVFSAGLLVASEVARLVNAAVSLEELGPVTDDFVAFGYQHSIGFLDVMELIRYAAGPDRFERLRVRGFVS